MTTSTLTAQEVLDAHKATWDMPILAEQRPDILAWLAERYEVHFGIVSEVIVLDKQTRTTHPFQTSDVRVALQGLLEGLIA